MQCLSQLITKEQTHLSKIWDTVQTCREENAILLVWSQDKYYFNFYEFLKLSRACDIVLNNIAKTSLFVMFIICFLFLVSPFYFYFFILYGLTHHPPPATRHPLPVTRYPPLATRLPATRHPSPAEKSCRGSAVLASKLQEQWIQLYLKSHLPQFLGNSNTVQPGLWEFLICSEMIKH